MVLQCVYVIRVQYLRVEQGRYRLNQESAVRSVHRLKRLKQLVLLGGRLTRMVKPGIWMLVNPVNVMVVNHAVLWNDVQQ